MKSVYIAFIACWVLSGCYASRKAECQCNTVVTVRNMTGFDGCKYLFELPDGTRLEPVVADLTIDYSTLKDGDKVRIGYRPEDRFISVCMAGKTVRITCFKKI